MTQVIADAPADLKENTTPLPTRMTAAEFEAFAALEENADRRLEWHDGEMFEMVAAFEGGSVTAALVAALRDYLKKNRIGLVTISESGFVVNGARYMPDAAYITTARKVASETIEGYTSVAPDLAIEAISSSDKPRAVAKKIRNYLAAGTIVWAIYPDEYTVEIHAPGAEVRELALNDTLDGGAILPDFSMPVAEIFEDLIMLAEAQKKAAAAQSEQTAP